MVWGFLATLLVNESLLVLSSLLDKRAQPDTKPGEPQFPKADATAPIPAVFGTTRIGLNVVHKLPTVTGENTVRSGALTFGWFQQHIGYFYYLNFLGVLCHGPVGALIDIIVDGTKFLSRTGDQPVPGFAAGAGFTFATQPSVIINGTLGTINALPIYTRETYGSLEVIITAGELLGGKLSRGGIGKGSFDAASSGIMRFFPGTGVVEHNARLEALAGTDLPCFPRLCTVAVEDNFYFGNSEQLPSIEFVIARGPDAFSTGFIGNTTANGGQDANAAGCLWDVLANDVYGLGLPTGDLDFGSFLSLARATDKGLDASAEFNVGLSFVLSEKGAGKAVVADILRTLDATLYTDPVTGKLCVWLIRAPDAPHYGYSIQDEIILDESSIKSLVWTRSTPDSQVNQIVVEFIDRARDFTKNSVIVRNVAAIQALGRVESKTVSFFGVQDRDLAIRLGTRELRAQSTSLGKATIELNRIGYLGVPGRFFTLNWPKLGFSGKIMRFLEVRDSDTGGVTVQAVEDIYSSPATAYAVEDGPEPTPVESAAFVAPIVEEDQSTSGSTGTLKLYVYDPRGVVTSVEFQSNPGGGSPSGYAADSYPYAATVALDPVADSSIDYRVTYTDRNGDPQTIARTVIFPIDAATAQADADAAGEAAGGAGGRISHAITFFTHEEELATIPDAETEIGVDLRRRRLLLGAGSIRLNANVKTPAAAASVSVKYSDDGFATDNTAATLPLTAAGEQTTGWLPAPAGLQADLLLSPFVSGGGDTDSAVLTHLELEVLPGIVTALRDHSDDHSDDYS